MGRKSTVDKLEPKVRTHIEKRLRENRLTLDELIADLQDKFPADDKPSRSALGRYRQGFEQMVVKMREQELMSRLLVQELGENPDDKAGALMMQSITTLVNHAALTMQDDPDVAVEDVRKLARAANDAMRGRKVSREERVQIERLAREKLLEEQEENLQSVAKAQGMDEEQVKFWREKVLFGAG